MKRFSQTLKVVLALFVAVFSNGLLPSVVAAATPAEEPSTNITEVVSPLEEVAPVAPVEQEPVSEPEGAPLLALPAMQQEEQIGAFAAPQYQSRDTLVVPVEPSIKDICGTGGDTYAIPAVVGVEYWLERSGPDLRLTDGQTYSTNDASNLTITAKTKNGYVFANNKHEVSWRLDFSEKCVICHRTASAGNPYVQIEVDDSSINGRGNGDHYLEHTGPVFPATGTDGKWGDIIPPLPGEHSGLNWTAEGQSIYDNDCVVPVKIEVTPGPCAYSDTTSWVKISLSGTAKNTTLLIKDASGATVKEWDVKTDNDGNITSPSFPVTYSGLSAGEYSVEVVSKKDGALASTTFVIEQCYYTTYPEEPKKLDMCYGDKDKIYVRSTEGVIYRIGEDKVSGWIRFEGETIVVTAEAAEGYVLDEEAMASWTFDKSTFANEDCLTITKTSKVASDTNHNGVIDVGDEVSWEITVTNTSESKCESFYVTVEDENVTLENDGYIGYLGAGKSVTLTATSSITITDLQACKISNTATFYGWRANKERGAESLRIVIDNEESDPLAMGSATAVYTLTCPTPGSGSGGSTPVETVSETPAALPATGPVESGNPIAIILATVIAYGATYFLQRRRELMANN